MKKLVAVIASLLLSPALGVAQDTVPDAPSLKEIRQRAGWAVDRADNLQAEIAAAIEHLIRLRAMADSAVARDSVLALRPDPVDTVVDTVEVGTTDSLPPAPPGRPIEFARLDSTSVEVQWGPATGARWYQYQSSAGTGWTESPSDTLDLADGAWICLWAANGAGRSPDGSGVCASYSEPADTTATDTVAATYDTVRLNYELGHTLTISPDSAQIEVGDTVRFAYAHLVRRGDSTIVGCISGYCTPHYDSIRPAVYRDSVGFWIGPSIDPDAPDGVYGFRPMSVLDSIIAERSAT